MVDQYALVEGGPSFTPLRFGLLTAAELPATLPREWTHGTMRVTRVCGPASSTAMIPCSGTPVTGEPTGDGIDVWTEDVFRVYGWEPCSPVGFGDDLADLKRRAEQRLTDGEARAVERVFWTGHPTDGPATTVYPHLAADAVVSGLPQGAVTPTKQLAATEVTSSAVTPAEAVALLEGYLGECYGGEGVIHVPRAALALLDNAYVVRREGEQLRTLAGNRVAAYSGGAYPGPDGVAPGAGTGWFYATGAVQVKRGQLQDLGSQPGEIVGREQNTTLYLVYRLYSVTFDCCLAAAEVALEQAP